ncbi:succinate dehydrogenase, hydrophobic membrane anchor protein [Natronospirillum operosum]|uniref:Succinate dehydrogenase hydrophobic membrane anchor subunit n=1 Tax=Natronospirillum operosum TaxID=2759953 RepID=A0A4Z0WC12_9GAMM|nr:succinate dehydrogenase, hydrophobic membrane anchor protein [Natronospirillum operosum]TGG95702.1 succinate dehydrogenase, hydrophobic membrane anchor protein [Natronospirillum operosum]
MVKNITSFTGNGVADWLVQRVSAVILAAYTLFLVVWFLALPEWSYEAWSGLFAQGWMKIFTVLAVLSFVAHAWIGIWTATTDYLKSNTAVRILVQLAVILVLFIYLIVTFDAVWGV